MSFLEKSIRLSVPVLILLFVCSAELIAQTGTIEGVVYDSQTEERLPGANVSFDEGRRGTTSDQNGRFRFRNVNPGSYTLSISYIGFENQSVDINVEASVTNRIEIRLSDNFVEMEGITVTGYRGGQASALNQQRSADNIKNVVSSELIRTFPDHNTAEALQRVPGISIQRDQGEGRYIQIRGTDPRLSNISINGETIPSPEGDIRSVALDVIPSNMLSSIEVSKAITPDMDGDAIGGSVNLNTLQAIDSEPFLEITAGTGYNNQASYISPVQGNGAIAYGQRFGEDEKLGFVFGASYNLSNRGNDNNEMEYDDGELEVVELRDYEVSRIRAGVTTSMDYRFNSDSRLFFSGIFNYFSDQEYRRGMIIESDVIERELKDRFEAQSIASISAGGQHLINNAFEIDYGLSYSYAQENTDPEYVSIFVQEYENFEGESIDFMEFEADEKYPQFSVRNDAPSGAGPLNYNRYQSDEFEVGRGLTTDQHFTSRLNLKSFYTIGQNEGELKFGGLFRAKRKDLNPEISFYEYGGDKSYADLLGSFQDNNFFFGRYNLGQSISPQAQRNLFNSERTNFEWNSEDTFIDSRSEDYTANEYTGAAYAMTKIKFGKLNTIVGARYENTSTNYTGYSVEFDENGDLLPGAEEIEEDRNFGFFLPMAHITFRPTGQLNLRAAWTNTISKPNYFDLAPYRIINREDREIELGNPDIDPAQSMNFDLMAEFYFSQVGMISAGVFYKQIDDFRYVRLFENETPEFNGYETEQPVNGNDAEVAGFEVNLQQQLTFLPGFASGFGIYANYTYTWSEAELLGETNDEVRTVSLPGQSQDVANLALSYEKFGFTGRISANYNGPFVDELRDSDDNDRYYDRHLQIDMSASQQITPNVRLFVEMLNLTNEPLRYYNGVSERPEQQEYYSWWGNAGVKINF